MSLRIGIVHVCFDQQKLFKYVEPWLEDSTLTKEDFNFLWKEAARVLGEIRDPHCRCNYRVGREESELLVLHGIADYLITEWRFNEEKKRFFPAPNPNLVANLVALKTPRVETVEKAHIERAASYWLFGDKRYKEDADRIEEWGTLAKEVIQDLTTGYEGEIHDPTKGKPVISVPFGWDLRTCPGRDVSK